MTLINDVSKFLCSFSISEIIFNCTLANTLARIRHRWTFQRRAVAVSTLAKKYYFRLVHLTGWSSSDLEMIYDRVILGVIRINFVKVLCTLNLKISIGIWYVLNGIEDRMLFVYAIYKNNYFVVFFNLLDLTFVSFNFLDSCLKIISVNLKLLAISINLWLDKKKCKQ